MSARKKYTATIKTLKISQREGGAVRSLFFVPYQVVRVVPGLASETKSKFEFMGARKH